VWRWGRRADGSRGGGSRACRRVRRRGYLVGDGWGDRAGLRMNRRRRYEWRRLWRRRWRSEWCRSRVASCRSPRSALR
jgi:hypothetical protein